MYGHVNYGYDYGSPTSRSSTFRRVSHHRHHYSIPPRDYTDFQNKKCILRTRTINIYENLVMRNVCALPV